ncbi:MAG: hypothetical protein CL940_01505 [Deltaproteobacteria bacterium]|nr:hypothetical protein [Deltaproteobacteria bacterium]
MKAHLALLLSASLIVACSDDSGSADATQDVAVAVDAADISVTEDAQSTDSVSPTEDATTAVDTASTPPADVSVDAPSPDGSDAGSTPDGTATSDIVEPPDAIEPEDVAPAKPQPTEHPPIQETYETWIGDWEMTPGQENTRCVIKKLNNEEPIWVTGIHSQLGTGSHHMIVYRTADSEEQPEPFDCDPFTETLTGNAYPLLITQVSEESLVMPPGVAVKFEPFQTIRIEAHFLNYYPESITAHGDVSFDTINEEDVWSEADMLFYGDVGFELPPNQEYQTNWAFLPVSDGVEVFAMTGHTHQYGTNVEVYHADDVDDDSTPVYPLETPFQWDEAPVTQYDPPLKFNGSNGLRFRCSWNNTSDKKVGFGESANQEMCFVWAYYYPSSGYQVCVDIKGLGLDFPGLGDSVCCPGSFVCDLIPGFL